MEHHGPLIGTIVAGIGLAFALGLVAHRLRLSPLLGYLVAGVLIGPFTPGYVADQSLALQLAEIGVILLMFGVGLHFSLSDLLAVRAIAIPGALAQIAVATLLGMALATWGLGWSIGAGMVFGLALSVASTVVLLRALQQRRLLDTERGRIAVGWLIVEDIVTVLALVLVPAFAGMLGGRADAVATGGFTAWITAGSVWGLLGLTVVKVVGFVALMLMVGRRLIPWILHYVAHTGSRELFRLSVFAIALGVALGAAELFGVSFALGAFFAGMVLAESPLSQQAANETLPLRDAFAVLFFVSVGMLFDPSIVLRHPIEVVATIAIILVGKSIAAFVIVLAFGHPRRTALMISASLAQVGEFSFILAGLGITIGLMPPVGRDLVLAGALFTILLNPLLFSLVTRTGAAHVPAGDAGETRDAGEVASPPLPAPEPGPPPRTTLTDHAVLVGYGRVGGAIGPALEERGTPLVVIDEREETIEALRAGGTEAIHGNAAEVGLLEAANLAAARWFVSAIPDPFECIELIERARAANPRICIVCRAHNENLVGQLRAAGADYVVLAESEVAREMVRLVLTSTPTGASTPPHDRRPSPIPQRMEAKMSARQFATGCLALAGAVIVVVVIGSAENPLRDAMRDGWVSGRAIMLSPSQPSPPAAGPGPLQLFADSLAAPAAKTAVSGRIYVPAYAQIRVGAGTSKLDLATTLSIHNSSADHSIVLRRVAYHGTDGGLMETFVKDPVGLKPLATVEVFVPADDLRGGSGANFVVEWTSPTPVSEPVVEAVMIGTAGATSYSFVSRGQPSKYASAE